MPVLSLRVDLKRRQVLRCLGYPRDRQPIPRVEERLEALGDLARRLIQPRGIMRLVAAEEVSELGIQAQGLLGLGVCTIGPKLEAEAARRTEADALLDALILDAHGSAAAEAAADALNFKVCAEARARAHHPGARFSPGYAGWDISGQAPLLGLLGAETLGITLTGSMMMLPRKSVSFVTRLKQGTPDRVEDAARRCSRCGMTSCAYREEEAP